MSHLDQPELSRVTVTIEQFASGIIHTYTFPVVEKISMDWKPALNEELPLGARPLHPLGPTERGQFRIEGEAVRPSDSDIFDYTRTDPEPA